MRFKSDKSHFKLILAFAIAFHFVGCGGSAVPTLADVNNTNLKKLRGAYGLYLINHNLVGPKNEQEFKEYLKNDPGAKVKMGRMDVTPDTVDDIFISSRDGQPFKIRWGLRGLADHAIVFEAEGVDGKRMVAFSEPREVGSDEYQRLWKSKASAATQAVPDEMSEAFNVQ